MDKIIGIGNALVDVLVRLDGDGLLHKLGLPKGGMQLIDEQMQGVVTAEMASLHPQHATGGSAGNAMLALANLGAKPGFVGQIGKDEFGDFFASNFRQAGIDTRMLLSDRHTGVANTFITPDGERTFATCLGAAASMTADNITPQLFRGYDLLHIEGYLVQNHELIETVARVAKAEGLLLSIDLASYNVVKSDLPFFRHLVKEYIDIVFANEEESSAFTAGKNPMDALEEIASMCLIPVVKLGSRGASTIQDGRIIVVPARKIDVVDTTAAGDFFAGGFLYAYTRGASLEKCLRCGSLLSEYVIQIVGTSLPQERWTLIREKVEEILK